MAQWCLVQDGIVKQLSATTFGVAPALQWVEDTTDTVDVGWGYNGTNFVDPNPAPPPLKDQLKAYAALYRYEIETGGVIFGGLPVATDDRSKALVMGAYNKALDEANPTAQKTFKGGSGFATVDNQTIISLALYMADHVQACFDAEKAVWDDIDADLITDNSGVETKFNTTYNSIMGI